MLLTDGYLANGSEPWNIPEVEKLEPFDVKYAQSSGSNEEFFPLS